MRKTGLMVLLMFVLGVVGLAGAQETKTGGISGKVMISERVPMVDGIVFIFNSSTGPAPSSDRYWRVPDEIVKTDAEGRFTARLADGTYYIGAILRAAGDDIGPPQDGDLFLPFQGNGVPKAHVVANGAILDIGVVTGPKPFSKATVKYREGVTAIEGKVLDAKGKPVKGAFVFAFITPAMVGKPLFITDRTGKDGKYILRVHQGGEYFLKIRSTYGGGAMKAGEMMGSYGQERATAVKVATGEIKKGINITGVRFPGQGPKKK